MKLTKSTPNSMEIPYFAEAGTQYQGKYHDTTDLRTIMWVPSLATRHGKGEAAILSGPSVRNSSSSLHTRPAYISPLPDIL